MWRLHQFGLAAIASAWLAAGCITGARSRPLTWDIVSLKNDDWYGSPRQTPVIDGEDIVLRGQNIRTQRSYSAPITMEFDAMLEGHAADDGALMCEFVPATQALDKEPERNLRILFQYDRQGGAISIRERFQRWPTEIYKVWSNSPLSVNPGYWHHMKYVVTDSGLNISIDGRTYTSDGAAVPYKVFYVSLLSWQPTNHWRVRSFSIR